MTKAYSYIKEVNCGRLELEIRESAILTALHSVSALGSGSTMSVDVTFKAELSTEDKILLDSIVSTHVPTPVVEETPAVKIDSVDISQVERALKVTPTKLEGSSTTLISHNFCDATTWYTESSKITGEVLTTEDNLTFKSNHVNWIDLTHGKVPYEHRLASYYPVIVYVDDVVVTSGYTIDYSKGTLKFNSAQTGVVKATFNKANGSGWNIKPDSGKILKIIGTDVKFTEDALLDIDHGIIFQLYVMGGSVPYGSPTIYNNMEDVIKCSTGVSYSVPPFSVFNTKVIVLPFDYTTSKDLASSTGALIKIKLAKDIAIPGTFGIVVAHCISIPE